MTLWRTVLIRVRRGREGRGRSVRVGSGRGAGASAGAGWVGGCMVVVTCAVDDAGVWDARGGWVSAQIRRPCRTSAASIVPTTLRGMAARVAAQDIANRVLLA